MNKQYPYLPDLIDLIYEKYQNLLPFLDVLREDINKLDFVHQGEDGTALITMGKKKFNISINIDFIKEYKLNNVDILWLLCHELSHFVLEHLNSKYEKKYTNQFRNIGYDCQVNSMLYNINERKNITLFVKANWENYDNFLKFKTLDFQFLVVPPIKSKKSIQKDFAKLDYDSEKLNLIIEFWFKNYSKEGLGLDEIFNYLEQIIPKEEDISENEDEENKDDINNSLDEHLPPFPLDELPESTLAIIEQLREGVTEEILGEEFEQISNSIAERDFNLDKIDLKKRKQNILKYAMKEVFFNSNKNGVVSLDTIQQSSILPTVTRKEASILSAGYLPTFYNNKLDVEINSTLAIYIDFSISTEEYHVEICKLLTSLKNIYDGKYFAFSTSVTEISFDDLLAGRFKSSGTDINPVVSHINENKFEKVLIITDGYFYPPTERTKAELFLLLFEETDETGAIEKMGKIKKTWYL